MNSPHLRFRLTMAALLLLASVFFITACAEDPFADRSQGPAFVGRDNSLTDPNATPPPDPQAGRKPVPGAPGY